ncbi:hypothetical protein ACFOZ7_09515 [Natribaculum luteum]|uniref:Uncharacterized protein n=1 Tax=Natribaculum luteum TaxID=1586232 RepID=A0ABD5NYQ1_9EURY|nr:hypothetical protein [Natribaculum luteum]
MDRDESLLEERDLARTYDGGAYDDAWTAVKQYRRVAAYRIDNPDEGYTAIANALELPVGRVRSWVDYEKTPNVVAGLRAAREHGWLEVTYDDDTFTALNALVANVYSGGSINQQNWQPLFVLNERGFNSHVIDALELADVGYTVHDEADDDRGPVIRPGEDGAILGRVLYVLGAPLGKKSKLEEFSLPWYLDEAPRDVRELFVHCYLSNRAYPDPASASIQIIEERPRSYREELAALIRSVADGPVTVGEESVTISADASRSLGHLPEHRIAAEESE